MVNWNKRYKLLSTEQRFFGIKLLNNNVEMYYTNTFDEYDELLTKNIILVDLFDASANNTILECLVRNTPIFVNKLPAVIEYLGPDYPLYFNNVHEINHLLTPKNIIKANEYLKNLDKTEFKIEYFINKIFNLL